ncbi:MAG: T9SS type A sorting domain-containing protein [Bacteroidetes bacterium]|nr:T9SS type A sorting domain-containing protein [Bacteroidota bacterium]
MKKLYLSLLMLGILLSASATPILSSYPSATATIFLDFDGHYVNSTVWNGGAPINCAPSGMSDQDIIQIFNRVSEDYRPFAVNITTDSTVFLAAPLTQRIRIIITPTSGWYPGVGGVTYVGSFTWGDDTPGFVFCDRLGPNSPKMVAEACSHESGHAVGLAHQSRYGSDCSTPQEQYNSGTGTGEASWAPIMGNSYYRNMSNWNNGPTPYGCTNFQDNLSIITTQNGFGYRPDDYTETMNGTTTAITPTNFSKSGIISTNTDKDAFRMVLGQGSNMHITAIPYNVGANDDGANLDVKLEIFNNAGTLINTYDPQNVMSITIDSFFTAGTYYFKISGTGNANIGSYGSLGSYTLSGFTGALAVHSITLSGDRNNSKHNLNWAIIADEPAQSIEVQMSTDGSHFNTIASVQVTATSYSWKPLQQGTLYYRLKVVSGTGQTTYSNTINLRGINDGTDNIFTVTTLIQNDIKVNASVPYQYQLTDMNGSVLRQGNGAAGLNTISMSQYPRGMYFIRLLSNNQQQTKRIIKQ